MRYLNQDEHECWACIHHQNKEGQCDTWCDHGESFIQREDVRTAQSVHRNSAHWYYDPTANDWGIGGWCCSNCHFKNDILGINKELNLPIFSFAGTKYCGNCGCIMKLENKDDVK